MLPCLLEHNLLNVQEKKYFHIIVRKVAIQEWQKSVSPIADCPKEALSCIDVNIVQYIEHVFYGKNGINHSHSPAA